MLEIPIDDAPVIALLKDKPASKAVPLSTMRSPKLAAMAANMNKVTNVNCELNLVTSTDMEEDVQENNPTLVKLEDILIAPEIINEDVKGTENVEFSENNNNSETNATFHQLNKVDNNAEQNNKKNSYTNGAVKCSKQDKDNCNGAGTSNSKDLSLSCIIPSGMSDAAYRLGSM